MARERRKIPWLESRDGTYYVYWYDETATPARTKRRSTGTSDPVEAQKWYAAFLSEGQSALSAGRTNGLKITDVLDDYFREHVQTKVVDKVRIADVIKHLKTWFKDELVKNLDIPASRAYADARRMGVVGGGKTRKIAEGSDNTIRRELKVLNAALYHAVKWKRLSLAEKPILELPQEVIHDEIWLTQFEVDRALALASGRLKDFMTILYYTAARRGSIEQLTRFQIDLENSRINLTSPRETQSQRRSAKRRPRVPIFPQIRPIIERLLQEHADSEYLFGDAREMYRPYVRHMESETVGLAGKSKPHLMRHSRATHLLQAGVDIYTVARLLGDRVSMVESVYGHHSADYIAAAIEGRTR